MVTARIPIEREGEIIGAVGTIIFKDVMEVNYMSDYIKTVDSQMTKYKHEVKRLNQAKYTFDDIIDTVKGAANTNSTICIIGESGTGKEWGNRKIRISKWRHDILR
jgi:transcriptional regulator with PAS, ATPase and Fis domain